MNEAKLVHPSNFYSICEKIGSGSYGNVYKARRNSDGVICALKRMDVKSGLDLIMIRQEVNTLVRCRHPNVVEFYEAYLIRKELWISMEFCNGGPINDIVAVLGPLEEVEVAYVVRFVMEGLKFIHSQKNIHRDIKGANILMTSQGVVKIADFGVAGKLNGTLDKRRSIIGSPYWMAPEVITAKTTTGYNSSCDIWSTGIFAIELAETVPPLYKMHPMDALSVIAKTSYISPTLKNSAKWSNDFKGFLAKSLRKNFKIRPTAEECLTLSFLSSPKLVTKVGLGLVRRYHKDKYGVYPKEDEPQTSDQTLKYLEKMEEKAPENEDTSSEGTILDETEDYYDHFTPEKENLTADVIDWRKQVKGSTGMIGEANKSIMGAYLLKVFSNVKMPPIFWADYWEDSANQKGRILLATEQGVYSQSVGDASSFSLIIPLKVTWLYVNMHNVAIVQGCIKNRDMTVYQFDLDGFFLSWKGESRNSKLWQNFARELDSVDQSQVQKCSAFYTVKRNAQEKQFFADFLIVKCLERVILFRWYTQGRKYAYVKEHSTPLYQAPVLSPIVRGVDPYPFSCFGAKKKKDDLENIEFSGVNFNSNSNWFANFIEENNKTLHFKFLRQLGRKLILGFHDYALIYDENGRLTTKITFDKSSDDFATVNDELVIVHKNGIIMKNLDNEVTQSVSDSSKMFRLVGSNGVLIFETTSSERIKDIYVLIERKDI